LKLYVLVVPNNLVEEKCKKIKSDYYYCAHSNSLLIKRCALRSTNPALCHQFLLTKIQI